MDPDNPVVKLCAEGMAAESAGRSGDAKALFEQAWAASRDDYEACIAAHYVARHQPSIVEELEWNRVALERAHRAGGEQVQGFYASLYLNYAHALEKTGRAAEACANYRRADLALAQVPDGPYALLLRTGVTAGRRRTCKLPAG